MNPNRWTRYPRIWCSLFRYSLVRELEFKTNFLGRASIEVVWILTQVIFFSTALKYMDGFGNLSPNEVWFFVGTLFFVDGLFMLVLHDNQRDFGQLIRSGMLDFHLLRPISSLFLANFRSVNVVSLLNLFIAGGIVTWTALENSLHFSQMLVWAIYIVVGWLLIACLGILTCSLAFWTTQTSNLLWLFFELYRLGFRPETLYARWLQRILLTIFPAALFMSLPVQLALGKRSGWQWHVYPFLILFIACFTTWKVWQRGLKRYEGALS